MDHAERNAAENDSVRGLVEEFAALQAAEAKVQAQRVGVLARAWSLAQAQTARSMSRDSARREIPLRSLSAELAAAARLNDRSVQRQLNDASALSSLFPATVEALAAGEIWPAHAAAVLDMGSCIDDPEVRAAFETVVLDHARAMSPGRLRAFARQLSETVHPRSITERFGEAVKERTVYVVELDDGMAQLVALLPVTLAYGIRDRLRRQARATVSANAAAAREEAAASAARAARPSVVDVMGFDGDGPAVEQVHDARTLNQIAADVFADILLTGAPMIDPTVDRNPGGLGAIRALVQLVLPVTTLTGLTDEEQTSAGEHRSTPTPLDGSRGARARGIAS
ncbi:DUF222 domain-containing protein [Microbacterium sp. P07]|uniref:DUF222 domain-containing protein n=1 Tax=Microbacterium sp. P07 TaxID=3366952 RepID=UPI003745BE08